MENRYQITGIQILDDEQEVLDKATDVAELERRIHWFGSRTKSLQISVVDHESREQIVLHWPEDSSK